MAQSPQVEQALSTLKLPAGLKIEQFSDVSKWGSPRMLALDKQGRLLVSLSDQGRVIRLNTQGEVELISQGLNAPHGIALLSDDLLVAEQTGVVKLPKQGNGWGAPQPFIRNLPDGGHRFKTVKVSPDGFIYVNVGSSCNVCIESNPLRATLLRFSADGRPAGALLTLGRHAQGAIWATGLRNSQGFAWHPQSGDLFATNNGADNRSASKNGPVNDDLPPEHFNNISPGKHYGWPYCWAETKHPAQMFQDPDFTGGADICKQAQAPTLTLPAHSTPIGLTFLHSSRLPESIRQDAIVALHGSWNRQQASGYALQRVKFRNHQPVESVPFIEGWLQGNQAWGRPVDVIVGADGWLYVSDDLTGWIYRVRSE
ncbi:MAG: PQQ-dependent sugar dehydrogenase [Methylophilus sp.]|uniref:PQQ-dependent sugar dehydrogenase n=1 Tax=Methylophilus sp. TaxID=29541 RepID=UPI003FA15A10